MNNTINQIDLNESLLTFYTSTAAELPISGSEIINTKRIDAKKLFDSNGFPTTKNEEWKYTNIIPFLRKDYQTKASDTAEVGSNKFWPADLADANVLVFIDGIFSPANSTITSPPSELIFHKLQDAPQSTLENYFSTGKHDDPFTLLNTSYAIEGLFIEIPKGADVSKPLLIYYISTPSSNVFFQTRNIILAHENSRSTIAEIYSDNEPNTCFSNNVTEIILKQDAHIDYYKIQNHSDTSVHVGTTEVTHESKSEFSATTITLGGLLTRNNLNINMDAEHSFSTMYGLYLLNKNQHVDTHTLVNHATPNCDSNELYKGILDDKSTGVFNGKIFVKQDAQKTNAFQSNKNILLSRDATINTKPQLEIYADDVKCSHGATSGQLDEEP
ncbi:MAG TPA: Fe-S cluster assembly protein SufD, partial [Cytophagaceae bacterium]